MKVANDMQQDAEGFHVSPARLQPNGAKLLGTETNMIEIPILANSDK
jgi:hypothetical protein